MTESVRSAVNPSQIGAGDMTDRPATEEARPDDGRWSRGGWHWLACWEQWSHDPERECVCDRLQRAATVAECPVEHVPLQERIDALARALYTAGLARSDLDKDGLPRLIAEGVYANLRKVQHLDLVRPLNAKEWLARHGRSSDPTEEPILASNSPLHKDRSRRPEAIRRVAAQAFYDGLRVGEQHGDDPLRTDLDRWQAANQYANRMDALASNAGVARHGRSSDPTEADDE